MSRIQTPTNQKRLTNVAVVRMKKGGKRFEIACYPNKVSAWRNKVEKDIDEVLQARSVFMNVSKGQVAKAEDLSRIFGTADQDKICLEILAKGELQVNERERNSNMESLLRDIATHASDKSVNPATKRPYPVTMLEKAMKDIHFTAKPGKSAKQQAVELIRQLQANDSLPIERAQMRLRVVVPAKEAKRVKDKIKALVSKVESETFDDEMEMVVVADPGAYRQLDELLQRETRGRAMLELLSLRDAQDAGEAGGQEDKAEAAAGDEGATAAPAQEEEEEEREEGGGAKKKGRRRKKKSESKSEIAEAVEAVKDEEERGEEEEEEEEEQVAEKKKTSKRDKRRKKKAVHRDDNDDEDEGHQAPVSGFGALTIEGDED